MPSSSKRLRFGSFEVDLNLRELRNHGVRVRLQYKPFQLLEMLLQKPGEMVRREEIVERLWPGLHVNFDGGLNTAVNTLRQVLGDSPRHARFIETLPGLGYRFLTRVEDIALEQETATRETVTIHPEAQRDFLKGQRFYSRVTEDDLRKAIAYLESAIEQEPGYALAHAGLAEGFRLAALLGTMPRREAYRRAKQSSLTSLALAGNLPEAHLAVGNVKHFFECDSPGAEAVLSRVLRQYPVHAAAHQSYAGFLAGNGRITEALHEIRHAHDLDPLSPMIGLEVAYALLAARDFASSIKEAWKALTLDPTWAPAQHCLGLAYEQNGMMDEAIAELENACRCSNNHPAAVASLGHAYAQAGKVEAAQHQWRTLQTMEELRPVSLFWRAIMQVGLGFTASALRTLEECLEQRDVWSFLLHLDPRLDPLRDLAAFQRLQSQLKPAD